MLKPLAGIEDEDTRDDGAREAARAAAGRRGREPRRRPARRARSGSTRCSHARRRSPGRSAACSSRSRASGRSCFFDDLHWAEPTFLRLIQYLGEYCRDAPILIVCSSRPDLSETLPGPVRAAGRASRSSWSRCPHEAAGALIANLLGDDVAPEIALADRGGRRRKPALHRGDGADAARRGADRAARRRWEPVRDLADVVLPPSIEALLAARLDRLEPAELAVLQRAAVIGRIFSWAAVRAISPEADQSDVAARSRP